MKRVVLTENQMKAVLLEEQVARILIESLNESKSFEDMKNRIKKALAMGVSVAAIISAISRSSLSDEARSQLISDLNTEQTEMVDTTGYSKKIEDVKKYMEFALKNQGFSMDSTDLKPETLVDASIKNNFSLAFMLAAAHLESDFGATKRAQKTNSVFSVGSYDNGKDAVTYDDPNDSVQGYIDLINRDYLVDGKTLDDLVKDGQFVNYMGKRYASNPKYEKSMRYLINLVKSRCPNIDS